MPVVVVTHNSTVGASIKADYVLATQKEVEAGVAVYRVYSGYPSDKNLVARDRKTIRCHDVLMNALEAGEAPYEERRKTYEIIKS